MIRLPCTFFCWHLLLYSQWQSVQQSCGIDIIIATCRERHFPRENVHVKIWKALRWKAIRISFSHISFVIDYTTLNYVNIERMEMELNGHNKIQLLDGRKTLLDALFHGGQPIVSIVCVCVCVWVSECLYLHLPKNIFSLTINSNVLAPNESAEMPSVSLLLSSSPVVACVFGVCWLINISYHSRHQLTTTI